MKSPFKIVLIASGAMLMLTSQSYITEEANKTSRFNTPFELVLNEKVFLPNDKKELIVSLVTIQDNRCPENIQCLTPGNATVQIKLVNKQGTEILTKLTLGHSENKFRTSDTASVTLNDKNYSVILNEVNTLFANKAKIVVKKEAI